MKKLLSLLLPCILLAGCGMPTQPTKTQSVNEIAPYPEAKEGYVRSVIYLPELKDESNAKVELLIGKEMTVDCNVRSFGGDVKQETLTGWGYNYYVVEKIHPAISTLMMCPPGTEKQQFVAMMSDVGLLRYNSRLPIVVYAPNDMQVKYRVWTLGDKTVPALVD